MRGLLAEYTRAIRATIAIRFRGMPPRLLATWLILAIAVLVPLGFVLVTRPDGSGSRDPGPASIAAGPRGSGDQDDDSGDGTGSPPGARDGADIALSPSGSDGTTLPGDGGSDGGSLGGGTASDLGAAAGRSVADRAGGTGSSASSETTVIPGTTVTTDNSWPVPDEPATTSPPTTTTTVPPDDGGSSGLIGGLLDLLATAL